MDQKQNIIDLVSNDQTDAVRHALSKEANVNTQDNSGRSLLLIATMNRSFDMAKVLVEHDANVNLQANNLDSAFLYAGASGQTELLKLFVAKGARFDVFNRYNGTALIPACERGHVDTVRFLAFTKDYPIDHVNRLGWTALLEAVILGDGSKRYQQIVEILKEAGADMSLPDHEGITPLQHARKKGFQEIEKIIKS